MMTAFFLLIKSLLGRVVSIIQWAIENWKITLPIIAVILLIFAYKHHVTVVEERDFAVTTLDKYVEEKRKAMEKRQEENSKKEKQYEAELTETKLAHAAIILQLKENYNATIKHKDTVIASANAMRDSLRRKLEEYNAAARLSEGANRSVRLAEIGKDGNAAGSGQADADYINTLEYACALTTADYNTLYDRCEAVNRIFSN